MESYAPQIWPLRYLRGFFVPLCAEMSRFLDHLRTSCTFLILVDSDWSLPPKEVDSGLTLLLV